MNEQSLESRLDSWRHWARFVFLGQTDISALSDADLRQRVCEACDGALVPVPRRVLTDALERLDDIRDEGPQDEGWRSDKLEQLLRDVRAALTPPNTESR